MKAVLSGLCLLLAAASVRGEAPGVLEIPPFGPAAAPVRWIGHTWQIWNKPALRGQFEKYLEASADEIQSLEACDRVMDRILQLLPAGKIDTENLDAAFGLLPRLSAYTADNNAGDAIAARILAAWRAQRQLPRLEAAAGLLGQLRQELEPAGATPGVQQAAASGLVSADRRLAAVNALIEASRNTGELSPAEARSEFQTLLVRLFLQRRFHHVLVASAFYRNIFDDIDARLRLPLEARSLFERMSDIPPTMNSLDALSHAAVHRAGDTLAGVENLVDQGALQAAANRLTEAFVIGEHVPAVGRFPSEDRQRILVFTRAGNRLQDAIDARDYAGVEPLVEEARKAAKDFDPSQPLREAQAARDKSSAHLERARAAAAAGDSGPLERELRLAADTWPGNPGLAEFSGESFGTEIIRQRALAELDQLMKKGDRGEIFRQKTKFLAATTSDEGRRAKLDEVLAAMTGVQDILRRARAMQQQGDSAGAWESLQQPLRQHPGNEEIARMSDELAKGAAATFVHLLEQGTRHEAAGDDRKALSIYRDLRRQYPQSRLAKEKVRETAARIPPDPLPSEEP